MDTTAIAVSDTIKKDTTPNKQRSIIDDPIDYFAQDSINFSMGNHKVYLYGKGEVHYKSIILKADYIEINLDENTIYAEGVMDSTGKVKGKPFFKQGKEEFNAKNLTYNFKTKKGLIHGVITEEGEGFLHGKTTKQQTDGQIHLKNGKYTTCNLENPHFYIALSKAIVIPEDKIVTGPAYMVVAGVPLPVFLPFGFFPNTTTRSSGVIIPDYGEEKNRGFFLRKGGYYFTLGEHLDLTVLGEYYTKGSWGLTVNSKYKKRYKFSGNLSANYRYTIINENIEPKKLFNFRWNHAQDPKAKPNSNFSASVNFGSTQYHRFDNSTTANYLSNTKQSSISYRKQWPNSPFNMSANFRHSQNSIDSTINLTLPEMSLTMNRIFPFKKKNPVGKTKWYEKIGVSYSSNLRNSIKNIKDTAILYPKVWMNKFENGIQHRIPVSTSINLKYFTISPSINYTERWYTHSIRKYYDDNIYVSGNDTIINGRLVTDTINGFNRAYDYSTSIGASSKLYGFFQFTGKNKNAIRHVLTPSVSFSYRPDFNDDKFGYYKDYINREQDTIRYSIYEKAIFGTPGAGKSGRLNFSLGNNLEMKIKDKSDTTEAYKKIKLIEGLSFSSSYNILADSMNWSPISFSGRTRLFNLISLTTSGRIDPYVYDSVSNHIINEYEFYKSGKIGRLTSTNVSAGLSINSKKLDKMLHKNGSDDENNEDDSNVEDIDPFSKFSMPWTFRIDYSLRYSKPALVPNITQAIRFSGSLNLTQKWKIGFSSGYDFVSKEFTYSSVNIARDLHCWQARFNWIPFGRRQQYTFTINAKASILQDLKYNKKKSWYDNF